MGEVEIDKAKEADGMRRLLQEAPDEKPVQTDEKAVQAPRSLAEVIATASGRPIADVERDLEHTVVDREEIDVQGTPPQQWPTFARGELICLKGIWFEVVAAGATLVLRPRGPSSALLRRLVKAKQRGGKRRR